MPNAASTIEYAYKHFIASKLTKKELIDFCIVKYRENIEQDFEPISFRRNWVANILLGGINDVDRNIAKYNCMRLYQHDILYKIDKETYGFTEHGKSEILIRML